LTKKESLSYDSKESKFKPRYGELSGQPYNQKAPSSHPMIGKFQVNLVIRKKTLRNSTLQSEKKLRRTLLLGNSQEKKKINPVIRKNLQVNPAIRKHQVFKPQDWEISSQPCN